MCHALCQSLGSLYGFYSSSLPWKVGICGGRCRVCSDLPFKTVRLIPPPSGRIAGWQLSAKFIPWNYAHQLEGN